MAWSPLLSLFRSQDAWALFQISRDWKSLLRLHFLHAALESGLLRALEPPRSREELIRELEVKRPELLDALLEMGVSLGQLDLAKGRYRLKGSRARALNKNKNDALAALVEANVTYYNSVFRACADRLQGGPLDKGVGGIGPLVARVSRIAEPYVEHFLERIVRVERPCRVLDVGCGSALHLRKALLSAPQATAVGLDVDPAVVDHARKNLDRWNMGERAMILQGDVRDPPEGVRGPFDLVLLFSIVYYFTVEERVRVLRAVREGLSRGGNLALTTSCRGEGMGLFSANLNMATTSMEGLTPLPTAEEMEEQLRDAGYASVARKRLIPGTTYFGFLAS